MFDYLGKLEELHTSLESCDWFSRVGSEFECDQNIRRVASWSQAAKWAQSPITSWCYLEAGNLLMDAVRTKSPELCGAWNQVATSALPFVESLLPAISAATPTAYREPVSEHLRSNFIGAYLEEAFSNTADLYLIRPQLQILQSGLFPCGWHVQNPESFPSQATVIVY